jgi:hypothetical protein
VKSWIQCDSFEEDQLLAFIDKRKVQRNDHLLSKVVWMQNAEVPGQSEGF